MVIGGSPGYNLRRTLAVLGASAAVALVAGCGGSGSSSASSGPKSVADVRKCLENAGLKVSADTPDPTLGETALLNVSDSSGPVGTVIIFKTPGAAATVRGTLPPAPGGTDQQGASVVQLGSGVATETRSAIDGCVS